LDPVVASSTDRTKSRPCIDATQIKIAGYSRCVHQGNPAIDIFDLGDRFNGFDVWQQSPEFTGLFL
jgi:hypothetical protein